ncbi:hypothetical protein [Lutibacter sp.]|uniref:hypothetical protein n=1 Tax=Lutibacter sp. TaxID=1925666 RepID=UPI0027350134|nr:hypothetical protein [Lutibacter sp.]MDP3312816.1 hypothetical protein [Lutibacter sp.]
MKYIQNILYASILSSLVWSCGGGGGDTPPPPVNNKPSTATLVYPTHNLLCINNVLNFQWNAATDPDGDALTYQIQVSKDNQFIIIAHSLSGNTLSQTISLEKGVAYYWRVKAIDSKNLSGDYSSTFSFYTEGIGVSNYLPFSPVLSAPILNSIVSTSTVTLTWTASDVDNDPLTYDVFLGTVNPPTAKIATNITIATVGSGTLTASTKYYWKVVVKDTKGGQTTGQVWSFTKD